MRQTLIKIASHLIFSTERNGTTFNSTSICIFTKNFSYIEGQILNLNEYKGYIGVIFKSLPKDKEVNVQGEKNIVTAMNISIINIC